MGMHMSGAKVFLWAATILAATPALLSGHSGTGGSEGARPLRRAEARDLGQAPRRLVVFEAFNSPG